MNGVIESRVSLQYKVIILGVLLLLSFVNCSAIGVYIIQHPGSSNIGRSLYCFISFPVIWACILIPGIIFRPQKISVSDYGILFYGNLFEKQQRITWEEIRSIATSKPNESVRNPSYYTQILQIELKNGVEFYIGKNEYQNYDQLKEAIYEFLHQGRRNDPLQ